MDERAARLEPQQEGAALGGLAHHPLQARLVELHLVGVQESGDLLVPAGITLGQVFAILSKQYNC